VFVIVVISCVHAREMASRADTCAGGSVMRRWCDHLEWQATCRSLLAPYKTALAAAVLTKKRVIWQGVLCAVLVVGHVQLEGVAVCWHAPLTIMVAPPS
jgi:hypothetical protein